MRSALVTVLAAGAVLSSPVASAGPDGCADLGGVVQTQGLCHIEVDTPTYQFQAKYPVDYPDVAGIIGYLTQERDGLINSAQAPGAWNLPYALKVNANSFRSERTRSVVLMLVEFTGGAHPTNWPRAFNFDVDRNQPITFDAVFPPGITAEIFPIMQDEMGRLGVRGLLSPERGLDPSLYQNFAITDDSVIFFFGRGELLPTSMSVTVPREQISPLRL